MFKKLIASLLFLVIHLQAEGIDKAYYSHDNGTWGQKFKRFLHLSNTQGFNKSYAIVIGINRYKYTSIYPTLSSGDDAKKIKDYLINEAGFDYVHLLTNDRVSVARVRQLMVETIPSKIRKNDRFLFFWSGHGDTRIIGDEPRGYLPVYSTRKKQYSNMISMKNLRQWDSLLEGKQALYLLDSCFSGLAGTQAQSSQNELTIEQLARKTSTLITAGQKNEKTFNLHGSSVFTTALLDGLRGEADSSNGRYKKDGIISRSELLNYLRKRISWEKEAIGWETTITPQISSFKYSQGEFFFFNNTTSSSNSTPISHKKNSAIAQSSSNEKGLCTKQITIPAVYKNITEKVLSEKGGTKYIRIPPTFKKVYRRVLKEKGHKIYSWIKKDGTKKKLEETFHTTTERVYASKEWEDIRVHTDKYGHQSIKKITIPPTFKTVTKKIYQPIDIELLPKDIKYNIITTPPVYNKVSTKEISSKPRIIRDKTVPKYKTITKTIKVSDSYTKTIQTNCN